MENDIKVSVIIPVYNAEKYIAQCLQSVIDQTLQEIEIIIVNDGSIDNSLQIVKDFQNKDKRIKIIDQENRGAGNARNTGMSEAKGKYLSLLDVDDFLNCQCWKKCMMHVRRMMQIYVSYGQSPMIM